jgi:phosphatidylinositol glycan class B
MPVAIGRPSLPALLALALVLRVLAAMEPGHHHPDAIYQYLEPARRLLSGHGVVTWEWRAGIRSWLLPTLIAGPMALGDLLGAPIIAARMTAALASLAIVWSAWTIGLQRSADHALLCGFTAAIWFECVHFGAQTLAEPLAAAALLPAAALLSAPDADRRRLAGAGALLVLGCLFRPHYAPAALAIALPALWRDRARLGPMALGGAVMLAMGGLVDAAAGSTPFVWAFGNLRANVIENRAAAYGVSPPTALLASLLAFWGPWTVPIAVGLWLGRRIAPALLAAAAVTLVVHSLIGHKEYRFVFLASTALALVSALGWAELASRASARRAGLALTLAAAGWASASFHLASSEPAGWWRDRGRAGTILFAAVARDPDACGIAIVDEVAFDDVPGEAGLRPDLRLSVFAAGDPANRPGGLPATLRRAGATFDRIVTSEGTASALPAGYRLETCEPWRGARMCLFARPGPCAPSAGSVHAGSETLARFGF